MDDTLTSLIIEAIPKKFLRGVIYGSLGVTNRTTYEIFEHLLRNTPETAHDKNINHARMTKEYNPDEHIQVLFHKSTMHKKLELLQTHRIVLKN